MAGRRIEAGDLVLAGLLAANRDPRRFIEPDSLDITRRDNPHIAFGHGIHYCLGAPLARLEGRIALSRLIERYPGLRLVTAPNTLGWKPNFLLHSLSELPVRLS